MRGRTRAPSYGFVIDNRRCIGCHACTVACKSEHEDPIGVNKTWVQYVEKGIYPQVSRAFHVLRCNHCIDAPCVEICPTASLVRREDGIVDFDPGRCIGCKACMQACPYDAITIHPDSGTATKCNYCAHRVDMGREPACVSVCPPGAIVAGDLGDPTSRIARLVAEEQVTVRRPEKGTLPKLYYIDGDDAALDPGAARRDVRTLWGTRPADGLDDGAKSGTPAKRGAPRRTYDIAQRHSGTWGWKVWSYLFTKSIASGVILAPALLLLLRPADDAVSGLLLMAPPIALIALAVTGVLLVADLRRPERFHWVLLRPQWRSWLVRGAYIISAYGLFLVVGWMVRPGAAGVGRAAWILIGATLATATAAYSGWLFGQAKGRDLWQSPLVPLHLVVQAVVAGFAFFLMLAPLEEVPVLRAALAIALIVNAAFIASEVWGRHATGDAAAAAHLMRTGWRGDRLRWGVFVLGHAAPLALLWPGGPYISAVAGALALAGVYVYEMLWVDAPQRQALA